MRISKRSAIWAAAAILAAGTLLASTTTSQAAAGPAAKGDHIGTPKFADQPSASGVVSSNALTIPHSESGFGAHGWVEHVLPDSTVYYSNSVLRVVTDIDLRTKTRLDAVMSALERKGPSDPALAPPPDGWELWLREGAGRLSYDLALIKAWVNHKTRMLTFQAPSPSADAPERIPEDESKHRLSVSCALANESQNSTWNIGTGCSWSPILHMCPFPRML